jgi:fatty acid desaturase
MDQTTSEGISPIATPKEPPSYTIDDLRAAIPPHCFQRSTIISTAYLLRDLALAATIFWLGCYIPLLENAWLRRLGWAIYGLFQGLVFTAMWLYGHECGHSALSRHKWFNHCVGLALHTFLLVPYHSWRFTHQTHHKTTNNLDGDIGFIPPTKEQYLARGKPPLASLPWFDMVEDTPIATLIFLVFYQLLAWPSYLLLNNFSLDRVRCYDWWKRSHFYLGGDGPSFSSRHFRHILISDIAMGVAVLAIRQAVKWFGAQTVMLYYGIPYLWTNHWMSKLLQTMVKNSIPFPLADFVFNLH